jgi:hypothetical protein
VTRIFNFLLGLGTASSKIEILAQMVMFTTDQLFFSVPWPLTQDVQIVEAMVDSYNKNNCCRGSGLLRDTFSQNVVEK